MWPLIKLQAKTYIKSPAIFFNFILNIVFLIVMGSVLNATQLSGGVQIPKGAESFAMLSVLAAIITITVIQEGAFTFGLNLLELKQSVLLKRIGVTKIKKWQAMVALTIWPIFLFILSVGWLFMWTALLSINGFFLPVIYWNIINWSGLIVGIVIGILISYVIGLLWVAISKTQDVFQLYGMTYFFFAAFLGGLFLPNRQLPWMVYLGYAIPSVYSFHWIKDSMMGANVWQFGSSNIFDPSNYAGLVPGAAAVVGGGIPTPPPTSVIEIIDHLNSSVVINTGWMSSLNLLMPIAFAIPIGALATWRFKWTT